VSAVDWKGSVLYDWTPAYYENQIVVESLNGTPVGLGGDSGSLVLTMDSKFCGLLFAGPTSGTHYIANHIEEVFNRLNVQLCCAPSEAVSGTEAKKFLPDLRRFREKLRVDKSLRKNFELYGKHSGKFLEAMLREPQLMEQAQKVIEAAGMAVRNPNQIIDDKALELGAKLIDAVIEMRKDDKKFLKDMQKAKGILNMSKGNTLTEVLRMLRK